MLEIISKIFGFVSIVKNGFWIGFLMILMSLIDPADIFAVIYRVTLKFIEFYMIWSSYSAFKLFKSFKKVKLKRSSSLPKNFIAKLLHYRKIPLISRISSTIASYPALSTSPLPQFSSFAFSNMEKDLPSLQFSLYYSS